MEFIIKNIVTLLASCFYYGIFSFGAMCRCSDATRLKWSNVRFELDIFFFEITFERRKKPQFHQGNKVTLATTNALVCPLKRLLKLKDNDVNQYPNAIIFRGFNGRLLA
jgi:hypothetical protein